VDSVGLRVQGLPLVDQVLVLARLAEARSEAGSFTAGVVDELFHELRLPPPAKTSNAVLAHEKKGNVRRGSDRGLWLVTPQGVAAVERLMTGVELASLAAEASVGGTQLGGARHAVIPPEMGAPPGLLNALGTFLSQHPFDLNVFGMTRFPDEERTDDIDPVAPALDVAREVCAEHGLEFHLASDRAMDDDLWTNIAAHMWASKYGIAFFEDLADPKRGINYNLSIEVGGMLVTGRRCALLKDESIERMPTDLVGKIYKPVNLAKPSTVEKALHRWIRDDLNLGPCPRCPM
jgi:hypothetical protein